MKQNEIDKKISKERGEFYNGLYKGSLPKDFMGYFKKAIFSIAPRTDNINTENLKSWIAKNNKELNFGEVFKMVEVITSVPRDRVFSSLEEALKELSFMELLNKECTEKVNSFEEKLNRKRAALSNMKGVKGGDRKPSN